MSSSNSYTTFFKEFDNLSQPLTGGAFRPSLSAEGRIVVVIEGTHGIGLTISQAFARAAAQHIIITGRGAHLLAEAKATIVSEVPDAQVHPYVSDLINESVINRIFDHVRTMYGAISVVVRCQEASGSAPYTAGIGLTSLTYLSNILQVESRSTKTISDAFQRTAVSLNPILIDISPTGLQMTKYPGYGAFIAGPDPGSKSSTDQVTGLSSLKVATVHAGQENMQMMEEASQLCSWFVVWVSSAEAGSLDNRFIWASSDGDKMTINRMEESSADPLPLRLNGWEES